MHNVTVFDVNLKTNKVKDIPFKIKIGNDGAHISHFCYPEDCQELNVKQTCRTNVIIRDGKGRFVSWKKLGKNFDLSTVLPAPQKVN